MRPSKRMILTVLAVAIMLSLAGAADEIILTDDTKIHGTVTRVVPGESVELLRIDSEKGIARLDAYPLSGVKEIVVLDLSRVPAALELRSGDLFRGTLIGSPLEPMIEFRGQSGTAYTFASDSVREIRLELRPPSEEDQGLRPGFGLGLSIAPTAIGVTRDAIAWFNEDWMLLAALGMHGTWSGNNLLGIGVSSDLTYLRKLGDIYIGIGTGVVFNMTEVAWAPTINVRVLIPFSWEGWQTTLSIGFTFRMQSY